VISIADRAFTGAGLTSITFTGENLTSIGEGVFFDCSSLTFITIPNSVNSIGEGVFYDCSSLTSVTLPESLTSIERVTFSNCSRLTSITIPTGVISIGEQAFYNCTGLTAVTIPANVTTIGYQAFYGCSGLTSITIPASVTSIMKAFDNCSSLTDITVEVGNTSYSSEGGVLFNDAKTVLIKYPEGKTDASYSIPNSVTGIGEHAFFACSNLTSVFIPEGMTDIGMYAFSGCSGLTSVTSLATAPPPLGLSAFNGIDPDCTLAVPAGSEDAYENSEWNSYFSSITGILTWNCGPAGSPSVIATLSDGTLTVFGSGDMEDYSGATPWDSYRTQIRTVVIEEGVTLIGNVAFSGCSNLNEVAISNSVVWIGTGAFSYCTSLYGISIPGSVTALGGDAFSGCSNLEDVEMNEGLKYINPNAFKDCSSLTSVTLPASVTSIEDYAFSGCTGLMEIENLQPAPQTINSNVFSGLTLGNLTLIVPTGTATLYEAAAVWEDFGTIVDGVFESYLQPQAGTYRIYPVTNSNSYLAADADNFLGSYNNQAPADGNATFYTEATGDGQYVLAVNHEKTAQYLRGRFLFDATDLAWTNGSGSSILDPGYLASGRTRLAFAEGIRVDNTLYVLDGEQVSDISQLESLAQEGKIRKIDLTADSRFSFGFRLVENYGSDFLLQTGRLNVNILSYVSIYNGIPVISRSDFQNALGAGTIFGMEVVAAPVPALTVSPSSLDFTVAGGSQTLDISSNATWTVTNPASWITVSATSGWSNGSITVTAAANSANASRTATVTVSINGIDRTVTVTQGTSALSVSPSSLDFTATGGSQTFDISSNVAWTVANMEPWATVSVSSGSGNGTVTVTVTPNSDYASRTATVEVSAGGISRTVDILQEGTPAPASLTVTPSSLDFATAGGSQEVDVVSNRNWTAVSDAPWLTVTQESGSVLRIAATANTGYARMDSVTVTADGLTQFVYVTQDAAQQIIAEPTPPANSQGSIQIALEIPVNEQFSITFTVTLPAGFVLDQQATSLVSGLLNSYQLSVTPNGLGGWLFEITPALSLSSLRNGEDTDYREIVNIVYTLQKGIQSGDYEVKIQDVDLTLDNGEVIHQDEINVPVRISDDVSNATVGATDVRYFNGLLYVNTPVAERITVYSLTGAAVYQSKKAEGAATFDLHSLPKGILIIRGESGWTRKVYSE
jgi:hypothetical protein